MTSTTSISPRALPRLAISLEKEIMVARRQLDTYLIISAVLLLVLSRSIP